VVVLLADRGDIESDFLAVAMSTSREIIQAARY
jgi:hypothetical protein